MLIVYLSIDILSSSYHEAFVIIMFSRDSVLIGFISEGTSIYSGLVVFSILGFMAHEADKPISEIVKSGTVSNLQISTC